jgi:hypothetical protein
MIKPSGVKSKYGKKNGQVQGVKEEKWKDGLGLERLKIVMKFGIMFIVEFRTLLLIMKCGCFLGIILSRNELIKAKKRDEG